ncbi:hypothetical protein MKX01_019092 [Papaver californicum]|nr:hypothetical protein MKX01_019092 [Papaver californicum]
MDRLLEQYDKESVRTTMLKQEKIFKKQVNIHSHKLIVNNPPDHQLRVWATRTVFETNNCSFTNTNNSGHNFHQLFSISIEPINSPEQSGIRCSRDNIKMHKDFDLESPQMDSSLPIKDLGAEDSTSGNTNAIFSQETL